MSIITWSDKYSVQHALLDVQHKKLFEALNQLYEAMKAGKGNDALKPLLDSLSNYTLTHFMSEEREMQKVNYPNIADHKAQHEAFIKKVKELKNKLDQGGASLTFEVTGFVKDWLNNHILETDKKYAPYVSK